MNILLVDDEPCVLAIIAKFLMRAGHSVETAFDGEHALKAFHQRDFHVVITDLGLPGMNGLMLAQAIKTMKPLQPVVLLTGSGNDGAFSANINFVLEKPVRWEALNEVLEPLAA
jgi:CheY-like chemotaxis protein